jgi:L-aspartate oxidase
MGEDLLIMEREGIRYCYGIKVFDGAARESYTIKAKVVVLATGGSGQLFLQTTNPEVATGDGLAMAIRAGAAVKDLQYIQFHPTAIYDDSAKRNLLISEALRGAGAYILNHQLQRFLLQETPRGELATRDVVSSLMLAEMKKTGTPYLFLDARHLGKHRLSKNFPQVFNNCKMRGYDLSKDLVPIVPAAHYQCGGIRVDHQGKSTVEYLYAVGECAATGLHGTNRLASNSLTEAMVFAKEIACDIVRNLNRSDKEAPGIKSGGPVSIGKNRVGDGEWAGRTLKELKTLMTDLFVNPENDSSRFGKCHHWIASCQNEVSGLIARGSVSVETLELHNLLTVGEALSKAIQKENVKHYKNIHI